MVQRPLQFAVFKTARSGSTWFASQLAFAFKAIENQPNRLNSSNGFQVGLHTFEPFGRAACYHNVVAVSTSHRAARDGGSPTFIERLHDWMVTNPRGRKGSNLYPEPLQPVDQAAGIRTILNRTMRCHRLRSETAERTKPCYLCDPANSCTPAEWVIPTDGQSPHMAAPPRQRYHHNMCQANHGHTRKARKVLGTLPLEAESPRSVAIVDFNPRFVDSLGT
jgi:hypothetical protein